MSNDQVIERVLEATKGNDAALKKLSAALLSHDKAQIKQVVHEVAKVDLTDEQLDYAMREYTSQEQIAANT
jgi:hypothetical protein